MVYTKTPQRHCDFPECIRPHKAYGLCHSHANQKRRGQTLTALRKRANKPEDVSWRKDKDGYLFSRSKLVCHSDRAKIYQHTYILEQYLGRRLKSFENVHHKNAIRHDNRIENLELWVSPQPRGARLNDLLDWVCEQYPEELKQRLTD